MSVPATAAPAAPAAESEAPSTGQAGANPAQEQRADPTPASSAETQEQAQRGPDYIREAFRAIRGQTQTARPAQEAPAESSPAPQAPPASSRPVQEPERSEAKPSIPATTLPAAPRGQTSAPQSPPPADRIVLTPEELQRRVQSEADRKLAKQRADDEARRQRELEIELRDTNPFEYARLMRDRDEKLAKSQEENQRLTGLLSTQLTQYDRNILDTLVSAVPEGLRKDVIAAEEGLVGRKKTVEATLKTLKQTWVNEGRQTAKAALMKDETFIKEILARYGGQTPEPEPVQARPSSTHVAAGNEGMNSWMRSAARGARSGAN